MTELQAGMRVRAAFDNGVVTGVEGDRVKVTSPRFYGGGWFDREQVEHVGTDSDDTFEMLGVDRDEALGMARDCAVVGISPEQLRLLLVFWARRGDDLTRAAKSDAWSEGFFAAHLQHYREDRRLSRRTPGIRVNNPYEEETT